MTYAEASGTHDELFLDIEHALGHRQRVANLGRQVRRDPHLGDDERRFLLTSSRYVPDCIPAPITLEGA